MHRRHVIRAATPALLLGDAVDALTERGITVTVAELETLCELGEVDWFGIPGVGIFVALESLEAFGLTAGNLS